MKEKVRYTELRVGNERFFIKKIPIPWIFQLPKLPHKLISEIGNEMGWLLIEAYDILGDKFPYVYEYDISGVRKDILRNNEDKNEAQIYYLKETREYWENRYSWKELVWFEEFHFHISEFFVVGKTGDSWFKTYIEMRGELSDFPESVSFSRMIENVLLRKIQKHIKHAIPEYIKNNPQGVEQIKKGIPPKDLPLILEIGLDGYQFSKEVLRIVNRDKEIASCREG